MVCIHLHGIAYSTQVHETRQRLSFALNRLRPQLVGGQGILGSEHQGRAGFGVGWEVVGLWFCEVSVESKLLSL